MKKTLEDCSSCLKQCEYKDIFFMIPCEDCEYEDNADSSQVCSKCMDTECQFKHFSESMGR